MARYIPVNRDTATPDENRARKKPLFPFRLIDDATITSTPPLDVSRFPIESFLRHPARDLACTYTRHFLRHDRSLDGTKRVFLRGFDLYKIDCPSRPFLRSADRIYLMADWPVSADRSRDEQTIRGIGSARFKKCQTSLKHREAPFEQGRRSFRFIPVSFTPNRVRTDHLVGVIGHVGCKVGYIDGSLLGFCWTKTRLAAKAN